MEQQNKILNTIQTLEEKILALQSGIKSDTSVIDATFSREFGWFYDG